MYKISIGVLCLILAVIFGNAMVVSGESEDETMVVPMGIIQLEPPEDVEAKKTSVDFPHATPLSLPQGSRSSLLLTFQIAAQG